MKVLLSVKPEFAEKILSGEKRFEFRTSIFRAPNIETAVLYVTTPVRRVVGEFEIDTILSGDPSDIWEQTMEFSGITKRFFDEYFFRRETAYAIGVRRARRYRKPLKIGDLLPGGRPPQSFCYLR